MTTAPSSPSPDRVAGGVYGLLVGDALGVPYEFHPPASIPPRAWIEMEPPHGFRRAHAGIEPGTWSDDGAHALCLLASLLDRGRLDVDDLGRRLVNWLDWGYLAVDDRVFDVGVQTARAIDAMRSGVPAVDAGPKAQENNGNGSLMRVLPLALVHRGTDEELARAAMLQSRVTHGHAWSQGCCALYVVWARRVLAGSANAYDEALAITRPLLDDDLLRQLDDEPRGTGFVIDTLRSARAALRHESYEDVVRAAIAFGNDTDTTAAVAGGLAGLRSGLSGIPLRWIERLRGRELVDPLVERLLAL